MGLCDYGDEAKEEEVRKEMNASMEKFPQVTPSMDSANGNGNGELYATGIEKGQRDHTGEHEKGIGAGQTMVEAATVAATAMREDIKSSLAALRLLPINPWCRRQIEEMFTKAERNEVAKTQSEEFEKIQALLHRLAPYIEHFSGLRNIVGSSAIDDKADPHRVRRYDISQDIDVVEASEQARDAYTEWKANEEAAGAEASFPSDLFRLAWLYERGEAQFDLHFLYIKRPQINEADEKEVIRIVKEEVLAYENTSSQQTNDQQSDDENETVHWLSCI